jgi:hypothetical protein
MSTLHEQWPGSAASAPVGGRGRTLPALLLALALPGVSAATPALEYGPEVEARFVERCAGGDAAAPEAAPCRRLMERLQAELGYPAFLEIAANARPAFEHRSASHSGAAGRLLIAEAARQNITAPSFQAGSEIVQRRPWQVPLALASVATTPNLGGRVHTVSATPEPVLAPLGLVILFTLHAEGAQIYECRSGGDGRLAWQFREPVATLLEGGRTVGHHYAGPSWEMADGSGKVTARVAGRLPGAGADDIPWLRLEVMDRSGTSGGRLSTASTILRVNTTGGIADGRCTDAGALRSVAYTADYVFLAPSRRE